MIEFLRSPLFELVFLLSGPIAMIAIFACIVRRNRRLLNNICSYCKAPISPRAKSCPTCGEPAKVCLSRNRML